jgi:hypothetical protein
LVLIGKNFVCSLLYQVGDGGIKGPRTLVNPRRSFLD